MDNKGLFLYGRENISFWDKLCAFVLVTAPLLQHYKGLVENAGFTVLLLLTPVMFVKTGESINKKLFNKKCFYALFPLLFFNVYTIIIRDFNVMRFGYVLLMCWVFVCIANGSFNLSLCFKYATKIAIVASVAIIVQYISHYLLGKTIDFRPLSLLVSQNVIWVRTAVIYGAAGYIYRPSGFFLEPSHFFLYSFPVISVLLLSERKTKKHIQTALFLSLGLLLSTSGMGIAVVAGLWALYFFIYRKVDENNDVKVVELLNVGNIFIMLFVAVFFYCAYRFIPFFQHSVDRIFTEDNSNAIDGRVRLVKMYVQSITGRAVWTGTPIGELDDLNFNVPGLFATYIKWGVVGVVLSYWFYIRGLFVLKGPYFWFSVIIIIISYFTAHTHGTFYMLYFLLFFMNGYYERSRKKILVNQKLVIAGVE